VARSPQFKQRLTSALGDSSAQVIVHQPAELSVFGAAILAQLWERSGDFPLARMRPVANQAIGFRTANPRSGEQGFTALIQRGTKLPVSQSTTFYTQRADQTRMVLDLVQADDGDNLISLGHFAFGPIRLPSKNHPVDVCVSLDEEGLMTVTAKDMVSGEVMEEQLRDDQERWRSQRELFMAQVANE
jgi:molecular chaperone DnaK (HSP70)